MPGTARIGPILVTGLLGQMMIAGGVANSFEHTGCRTALFHTGIENLFNLRLPTPFDEIFLERNFAFWSFNSSFDAVIRHGKNSGFDAEMFAQSVRNVGQLETVRAVSASA